MPSPKRRPSISLGKSFSGFVAVLSVGSLLFLWCSTKSYSHNDDASASVHYAAQVSGSLGVLSSLSLASVPQALERRSVSDAKGLRKETSGNSATQVTTGSTSGPKKTLVIGMAKGLLEEQLAVLAASFREHVSESSGDIVILMDDPVSARMREIALRYGVTLLIFDDQSFEPPFLRKFHPSTYRWPMIHAFLQRHGAAYRAVLTADVRDTMFQADPFAAILKDDATYTADGGAKAGGREVLFVFEDDPTKSIGDCAWNGGWVQDCFGGDVYGRLASKKIYCSGISLGTTQAMLRYTQSMSEEIVSPRFAECERNGVDQGLHNVLVHEKRIEHLETVGQANGMVAHMQASPGRITGPHKSVVNARDHKYAVVHQYDRDVSLTEAYLRRYVDWDRSEGGAVCRDYRLTPGADLMKGRCDLKPAGGVDVDMCCKVCDRQEGCMGFAFLRGVCFLKSCNVPDGPPMSDPQVTTGLRKTSIAGAVAAVQ